ncbi:hypothetical protein JQ574_34130 [Bradyrhizobium sp. AUGA SZCCT0158]|uniref:hypothetical protein n=1 Tax=Bradyrhizobium sp. AUGA SZCCT0158 TaxID=2807661 RepID=UPI001BA7C2D3|nr:hypothetical protein [Bradyrhizobium sp. AUGA SZCCT0158]MBR1201046.1 hypothetical protein [Bradyrhizobium sp. AUGA SZCCT0158]
MDRSLIVGDHHSTIALPSFSRGGPISHVIHIDAHSDLGDRIVPLNDGNFLSHLAFARQNLSVVWVVPSVIAEQLRHNPERLYGLAPAAQVGTLRCGDGRVEVRIPGGGTLTALPPDALEGVPSDSSTWLDLDLDFFSWQGHAQAWLSSNASQLSLKARNASIVSFALSFSGGTTRAADLNYAPPLLQLLSAGRQVFTPTVDADLSQIDCAKSEWAEETIFLLTSKLREDPNRRLRTLFHHGRPSDFIKSCEVAKMKSESLDMETLRLLVAANIYVGRFENACEILDDQFVLSGDRSFLSARSLLASAVDRLRQLSLA